jgi:hypothetical protein
VSSKVVLQFSLNLILFFHTVNKVSVVSVWCVGQPYFYPLAPATVFLGQTVDGISITRTDRDVAVPRHVRHAPAGESFARGTQRISALEWCDSLGLADPRDECSRRRSTGLFVSQLCDAENMGAGVTVTAQQLIASYLVHRRFTLYDKFTLAMAAVLLATKCHETPRRVDDILVQGSAIRARMGAGTALLPTDEKYAEYRVRVLTGERIILDGLGFNLSQPTPVRQTRAMLDAIFGSFVGEQALTRLKKLHAEADAVLLQMCANTPAMLLFDTDDVCQFAMSWACGRLSADELRYAYARCWTAAAVEVLRVFLDFCDDHYVGPYSYYASIRTRREIASARRSPSDAKVLLEAFAAHSLALKASGAEASEPGADVISATRRRLEEAGQIKAASEIERIDADEREKLLARREKALRAKERARLRRETAMQTAMQPVPPRLENPAILFADDDSQPPVGLAATGAAAAAAAAVTAAAAAPEQQNPPAAAVAGHALDACDKASNDKRQWNGADSTEEEKSDDVFEPTAAPVAAAAAPVANAAAALQIYSADNSTDDDDDDDDDHVQIVPHLPPPPPASSGRLSSAPMTSPPLASPECDSSPFAMSPPIGPRRSVRPSKRVRADDFVWIGI